MGPKLRSCMKIFFFSGSMGKISKTFNLEAILVSAVCGCRWCWQSRHQKHDPVGGKGKDLDGSCGWAVSPPSSQGLCREALETLSYFPQPQTNCFVCIKDGLISYLVSAGRSLPFYLGFLPACFCKSSRWARERTSVTMLPPSARISWM